MISETFYVFLIFTNHLLTDLTNPQPKLTHGSIHAEDSWPVIPRGEHTVQLRVNGENDLDGVLGSVTYTSVLELLDGLVSLDRKVTFHFECSQRQVSASASATLFQAVAVLETTEAPLNGLFISRHPQKYTAKLTGLHKIVTYYTEEYSLTNRPDSEDP